jgi:hypothetical protein
MSFSTVPCQHTSLALGTCIVFSGLRARVQLCMRVVVCVVCVCVKQEPTLYSGFSVLT